MVACLLFASSTFTTQLAAGTRTAGAVITATVNGSDFRAEGTEISAVYMQSGNTLEIVAMPDNGEAINLTLELKPGNTGTYNFRKGGGVASLSYTDSDGNVFLNLSSGKVTITNYGDGRISGRFETEVANFSNQSRSVRNGSFRQVKYVKY